MNHTFAQKTDSLRLIKRGAIAVLLALCFFFGAQSSLALPKLSQDVLSMGDYGADVEIIQMELKSLGIYGGEITGIFDASTTEAVKLLQTILGLKADGSFGPLTYEAYKNALATGLLKPRKQEPLTQEHGILYGMTIGIDPGHQEESDSEMEIIIPGTNRTKARQSAGSVGVKTGTPEYKINLIVALKLKGLLENSDATVIMTRETSDVSLSNAERAESMNEAEVDIWIRLHCDTSSSRSKNGASVLIPSREITPEIYKESLALGKAVLETFCDATGAKNQNIHALMNQAGFNWSQSPVIAVEMGFLSNASEDLRLNRDSYQKKCALGIYNGIIAYYEAKDTLDDNPA